MTQKFTPGNLVTYRNRDWMVLPSTDDQLLMLKPLGGAEEEITGVFIPLARMEETVTEASFSDPTSQDIGNFETAKLLYNASRLSLRNAAGPFRSMAKLSFRPRAYQVVPLVMALKQEVTRLLIADDVGIGKTVEALMIVKELIERGEIKRFAVICPPHLCEQWKEELKNKLDIEAEIIRSSTASRLDRMIADDQSVFYHIPYQVISIDYIKSDKRRGIFLNDCPEMVIMDEAHICSRPAGTKGKSQMQRFTLARDIAKDENRHLVLLSATPHSGKDEEFLSLLGLLKSEFEQVDFENVSDKEKQEIAKYFIQRKRDQIRYWLDEKTEFPDEDSKELAFQLSTSTKEFYNKLIDFAKSVSEVATDNKNTKMLRSWAAIALIKGAMSSPQMAVEMLENRKIKIQEDAEELELSEDAIEETLFEEDEFGTDFSRSDLLNAIEYKKEEQEKIDLLLEEAKLLKASTASDHKLKHTLNTIKDWLKEGYQPIVYCHYISTAHYVSEKLKEALPKSVLVECVTSELADEQRKEVVESMGKSSQRVLVATDCLSEGINLQEHFTAVFHYDLPWNPNRIEQREGRVNRFGQRAKKVKAYLLYGENNPMDVFILEVLIRKIQEIKRSIGVNIPIGENNKSFITELAKKILDQKSTAADQLTLFEEDKAKVENELEEARKKGERLRNIFAQQSVKPEVIKKDLQEVDEAIGDVKTVNDFVINSLQVLGANVQVEIEGYKVQTLNLPAHLRVALLSKEEQQKRKTDARISFESPTPQGYRYFGRNHRFVEQLCQYMIGSAFDKDAENPHDLARTSVIRTENVNQRTVLVMFRVRNVVKEVRSRNESVAEEMFLWAYQKNGDEVKELEFKEAKKLLMEAIPLTNESIEFQQQQIERELKSFKDRKDQFIKIATARADKLVEAHGRFKKLIGGRSYEKSTPVLPPDVMGVYILLPKPQTDF